MEARTDDLCNNKELKKYLTKSWSWVSHTFKCYHLKYLSIVFYQWFNNAKRKNTPHALHCLLYNCCCCCIKVNDRNKEITANNTIFSCLPVKSFYVNLKLRCLQVDVFSCNISFCFILFRRWIWYWVVFVFNMFWFNILLLFLDA